MRNAEILVVATSMNIARDMLSNFCSEIKDDNQDIIFGFFPIDDQFQIQLYGLEWTEDSESYVWEQLCSKILGTIILFEWNNTKSLSQAKQILHHFESNFDFPIMAASILNGKYESLPSKLYRGGLSVTKKSRFSFFNPDVPESIRALLVGLININLESISME